MSKPLGWGLIGAGDIARKRVAAALREAPGSELVAISRARPELAESFAAASGARRWHARWQDLIADRDVDAVYVATPVRVHAEQAIAAAEAGKHVLCEKPMAMTVAECDRIIAACRASRVALAVAYYRRFYPAVARIKEIIVSDEIGEAVIAQAEAFESFNPQPGDPRAWLVDKREAGGGPMMDFGCHRLELLLNLFGPVRSVTSAVSNHVLGREVEDTAVALLQFERGACATVAVTHAASEPRDALRVFGTRGSIEVHSLNAGEMRITIKGELRRESLPPAANVHQPVVDDFVDAVSTGRDPAVGGDVGRTVAWLEEEIYAGAHLRS